MSTPRLFPHWPKSAAATAGALALAWGRFASDGGELRAQRFNQIAPSMRRDQPLKDSLKAIGDLRAALDEHAIGRGHRPASRAFERFDEVLLATPAVIRSSPVLAASAPSRIGLTAGNDEAQ